ncbi:caspase family protein [Xanthobacter sp. AM11]|uniref:caspase family protein n=1 Tax=Xanthobacter sp. AM11 TaxID=3380643 RepID=UPI0039BF212E
MITLLGALALLAGSLASAQAERRVALVIGNSSYRYMTALKNPRNDANDVATALRDLGFEVIPRNDVTRADISNVLKDFSRLAAGADTALFYYAGHALEFRGRYFLVPTDAELEAGDLLQYDTLSAEDVREVLAKATGVRLMIFDACRNDPLGGPGSLSPEAARGVREEALSRFIAGASQGQGMVMAYATAPFSEAEDGATRNSPFTHALLKWLREAEMEVRPLFQRVSRDVFDQTGGRQVPEISLALNSPFVLNRTESHHSAWLRIRMSSDPLDFRDFLARFPHSEHAARAARRLEVLERAQRLAEQRQREEEARRRAEEERRRREEAEQRAAAARAEQARLAEERRRTRCAEEAVRIEGLHAAGLRVDLDRLKAGLACPEESGPRLEAALTDLAEQEARAQRARAEALCRQEAERVERYAQADRKDDLVALEAATRCAETRSLARRAIAVIERHEEEERSRQRAAAARREEAERQAEERRRREAACAEEARRIRDAAGGPDARAGLEAIRGRVQCEENVAALEAGLSVALAKEAAAREAAASEAAAREAAAKDVAARQAALREAAVREAAAREVAAKEAAAKEAAARESSAKEAAAREVASREAALKEQQAAARAACSAEAAAYAALDAADPVALTAFVRTARCPDVAAAARAQIQRLAADRDRIEQACARDRGEFERLRQLGVEGRDRLEHLATATTCEGLKPLVVAALGPGAMSGLSPAPAVNAPEHVRRAARALRQIGCFDGADDDGSLDSVRAALRKYYGVRDVKPASLDVDEAVAKRLEAEGRRRVCPLECPKGQEAQGERCVPVVASRPPEAERPASKPAAKPAPKPAAKPAAKPAPAAAKPAPAPKPSPPVAAAPPARRAPTIILGN